MDDFDLKTPSVACKFFFELHNLPSALPLDGELSKAKSYLDSLRKQVADNELPGFTGRTPKTRKTNSNATPGNNQNPFHNISTAQLVSSAGYELLPEVPVKDWTPLNPVRSFLI